MSRITYNADLLKIMRLFESVTRAKLKDAFIDGNDLLTFVVQENEIGKAIGKRAVNVKKLERLLKRKIKIVEFDANPINFLKNLTSPLKVKQITQENNTFTLEGNDTKTKGLLIGRNSQNLKNLTNIVGKYFAVDEIKVI